MCASLKMKIKHTWVEAPLLDPVIADLAKNGTSWGGLGAYLLTKFRSATEFKEVVFPLVCEHVHEVHTTGIRDFNRCDGSDEERWEEGGHK